MLASAARFLRGRGECRYARPTVESPASQVGAQQIGRFAGVLLQQEVAAGQDFERQAAAVGGLLLEHGEGAERMVARDDPGGSVERGEVCPGGRRAGGGAGSLEKGWLNR